MYSFWLFHLFIPFRTIIAGRAGSTTNYRIRNATLLRIVGRLFRSGSPGQIVLAPVSRCPVMRKSILALEVSLL